MAFIKTINKIVLADTSLYMYIIDPFADPTTYPTCPNPIASNPQSQIINKIIVVPKITDTTKY